MIFWPAGRCKQLLAAFLWLSLLGSGSGDESSPAGSRFLGNSSAVKLAEVDLREPEQAAVAPSSGLDNLTNLDHVTNLEEEKKEEEGGAEEQSTLLIFGLLGAAAAFRLLSNRFSDRPSHAQSRYLLMPPTPPGASARQVAPSNHHAAPSNHHFGRQKSTSSGTADAGRFSPLNPLSTALLAEKHPKASSSSHNHR
ncbi:unnamed protein product [Polarella glacialis]|uniref:Uncharacterized protein n=1 Tax=Polarella glacialis TaxID=89957 RepID=A0A813J9D1_POLGL|nr:unnamed protein product [Polarella glacialis]CAE8676703.1 unnamed protein product [Polarella glacialis]